MKYRVLVADEAIDDIFGLVRYIYTELCNPAAAEKLYYNLNREVYVLRVIKDLMNWQKILDKTKVYHFSNYD